MKQFLVMLSLLFSFSVFASGKIMVQPQYFTDSHRIAPMVGLSIYEKIPGFKSAYNGWAGLGDQIFVDREDVTWYTIRHAVDFYTTSALVLSPGVQSIKVDTEDNWQHRVFVRATYQLW
jgi:hypothetical protein